MHIPNFIALRLDVTQDLLLSRREAKERQVPMANLESEELL